ncbi:MAG TPA: pyrimidine/purine nucleoside phosphorylase [Selenomonadales bacterium]|nr:pyrimidine/purine nucleoside phosphorylase [Selenomonadales bacterium]
MFKINQYFDSKVVSLAYRAEEGPATIGVMDVGEYEFATAQQEHMKVITGAMKVQLPGRSDFIEVGRDETFSVEANQRFRVQILKQTAYLCLYK